MPKEKKGILNVILNGDNPVKVSKKQSGKLRNLFKKIVNGLTTVSYIPGAVFEAAVERKKLKKEAKEKEEEYVPFAEHIEKKIKEAVEAHKNENENKEDTANNVNADTKEEENVTNDNKETEVADSQKEDDKDNTTAESENSNEKDDKKANALTGQKLGDFMAKYNAEHESVKPVEIDIPKKEEIKAEVKKDEETNNVENNTYENIGEDYEPDTTSLDELIEKHGDLTKFASWDDYYNSLSEKKLKEMTRKGTLLQENVFTDIRMRQAEEYIRIDEEKEASRQVKRARLVNEEEDRQARKEANREEKKQLNRRIAEIDKEQDKLTKESTANKRAVNKLDAETEANKAEIEAMKKITAERKSLKEEEDKIMNDIYNSIDSKEDKNDEKVAQESAIETEPENNVFTNSNNEQANQDEPMNTSSVASEEVEPETADNSTRMFGLPAPDTQDDLVSEISDPNAFNNESEEVAPAGLDYMGFDPQTRSELGQEAFNTWKNSDGIQTFDEIKNSLADEYRAAGKGKTK